MTYKHERLFLQVAVVLGGFVPVIAGGMGMLHGSQMLSGPMADISLDSHIRYLSGLLFAIGLAFWSCIPSIETKTVRAQTLTFLVVIGGCARLAAIVFIGVPALPMVLAVGMELVITPLLCLWQWSLAKRHA